MATSFGQIPAPARTLEPTYTVEPVQDGERQVTLRRVGDVQAILAVYHVPDGADPDIAAIDVLAGVLGEAPSGRLYKALVDTKKADAGRRAGAGAQRSGHRLFGAILNKADSVEDARTIMLDTIDSVVKTPPTKEEVDRARTRLLKEHRSRAAQFRAHRPDDQRMGGQGRLAPDVPEPGSPPQGDARGRAARGQGVSEDVEPHHRRVHPRRQTGPGGDSRQEPTSRRW